MASSIANVVREVRLFGLRMRRRSVARREIRAIHVQRAHNGRPGGVAVVGTRTKMLCGPGLGLEGRKWLRDWLSQQVGGTSASL